MVRLYALNLATRIKRDNTPYVTVVDPYYMRDSQLVEGSRTRTMAKEYLQRFMLTNKRKNSLLLPFFPEYVHIHSPPSYLMLSYQFLPLLILSNIPFQLC